MSDFIKQAYFGDHDVDSILQRIAYEVGRTDDALMKHILSGAAAHFSRIKREIDVEGAAMFDAFGDDE